MATYTPYDWSPGDKITSARLDNIETQYASAMTDVSSNLDDGTYDISASTFEAETHTQNYSSAGTGIVQIFPLDSEGLQSTAYHKFYEFAVGVAIESIKIYWEYHSTYDYESMDTRAYVNGAANTTERTHQTLGGSWGNTTETITASLSSDDTIEIWGKLVTAYGYPHVRNLTILGDGKLLAQARWRGMNV